MRAHCATILARTVLCVRGRGWVWGRKDSSAWGHGYTDRGLSTLTQLSTTHVKNMVSNTGGWVQYFSFTSTTGGTATARDVSMGIASSVAGSIRISSNSIGLRQRYWCTVKGGSLLFSQVVGGPVIDSQRVALADVRRVIHKTAPSADSGGGSSPLASAATAAAASATNALLTSSRGVADKGVAAGRHVLGTMGGVVRRRRGLSGALSIEADIVEEGDDDDVDGGRGRDRGAKVQVQIIGARGLAAMDRNGSSDPYAGAYLATLDSSGRRCELTPLRTVT